MDELKKIKGIETGKLENAVDNFMALLPQFMQNALQAAAEESPKLIHDIFYPKM